MFLRCKDTFNANKISSKILKNCINIVLSKQCPEIFKRNMCKIFAHIYVIPSLYFNFSDFKTRRNIYIYIFFFLIYQANYHE